MHLISVAQRHGAAALLLCTPSIIVIGYAARYLFRCLLPTAAPPMACRLGAGADSIPRYANVEVKAQSCFPALHFRAT
ncbi:hypothetical protein BC834DRAFT_891447 [Gloeopeniophorella convolvens]|nr:hypothetical protein BC834DRAFT_891447 [Gloeopeniophorella convolvens]